MRKVHGVIGLFAMSVLVWSVAGAAPLAQQAGQEKQKEVPKEAPKEAPQEAAAADPISGDWDGSVDTPNGPIAFTMKLKVEKDKVTGEIGSPEGNAPASGTWAEGKLTVTFPYATGDLITMAGALKDGQLSGDLSLGASGMVMPWSAKKKV